MLQLNGHVLRFDTYPNGETKVPPLHKFVNGDGSLEEVFFRWESDADLVCLCMVGDYLRRHFFPSRLEIAYMPYSRMDRLEGGPDWEKSYACAVRAVQNLIDSAFPRSDKIVWDPHSAATLDWDHCHAVYPNKLMFLKMAKQIDFNPVLDYIVFPDKGALERYGDALPLGGLYQTPAMGGFYNTVALEKKRNYENGRIESLGFCPDFSGFPSFDPQERRQAIILDDLCSYGGTFVKAAELLHSVGFDKVHLLVTHLEPACLKGNLFDHVFTVWGSDSLMDQGWHDDPNERLYIYTKEEWQR